ncbi:unnamed protein product, partial [Nesidiocoris tenuis]
MKPIRSRFALNYCNPQPFKQITLDPLVLSDSFIHETVRIAFPYTRVANIPQQLLW